MEGWVQVLLLTPYGFIFPSLWDENFLQLGGTVMQISVSLGPGTE